MTSTPRLPQRLSPWRRRPPPTSNWTWTRRRAEPGQAARPRAGPSHCAPDQAAAGRTGQPRAGPSGRGQPRYRRSGPDLDVLGHLAVEELVVEAALVRVDDCRVEKVEHPSGRDQDHDVAHGAGHD